MSNAAAVEGGGREGAGLMDWFRQKEDGEEEEGLPSPFPKHPSPHRTCPHVHACVCHRQRGGWRKVAMPTHPSKEFFCGFHFL